MFFNRTYYLKPEPFKTGSLQLLQYHQHTLQYIQDLYLQLVVNRIDETSASTIPQSRQSLQTATYLLLRQTSCLTCDVIPADSHREPISSRAREHSPHLPSRSCLDGNPGVEVEGADCSEYSENTVCSSSCRFSKTVHISLKFPDGVTFTSHDFCYHLDTTPHSHSASGQDVTELLNKTTRASSCVVPELFLTDQVSFDDQADVTMVSLHKLLHTLLIAETQN